LGAAASLAVHGFVAALLVLQPARGKAHRENVELTLAAPPETRVEKALPSLPAPPPPTPVPAPRARMSRALKAPPAPPQESAPPPPKFDLGANTFAMEGGSWGLTPSAGDSTIGALGSPGGTRAVETASPNNERKKRDFRPASPSDLTRRPSPARDIAVPRYPAEARRDGIEGAVVLRVEITKEGRVRSVRIVSDPGGGLGAAARIAMLEEVWEPALDRRGDPVDTVITYSYRFVLEG